MLTEATLEKCERSCARLHEARSILVDPMRGDDHASCIKWIARERRYLESMPLDQCDCPDNAQYPHLARYIHVLQFNEEPCDEEDEKPIDEECQVSELEESPEQLLKQHEKALLNLQVQLQEVILTLNTLEIRAAQTRKEKATLKRSILEKKNQITLLRSKLTSQP